MSFWDLGDGTSAKDNVSTDYQDTGFKMIPDKSNCLASICEVKWQNAYQSEEKCIQIIWEVEKPSQFAGIKVPQKLWVTDLDPNAKTQAEALDKQKKARVKLARIDAFGKSKLMNSGKNEFTDDDLAMALHGIRGVVFIMRGETNGNEWNRVIQINPLDTEIAIGEDKPPQSGSGAGGRPCASSGGGGFDLGDEIPFSTEWRV